MDQPPQDNQPFEYTEDAIQDVHYAVRDIILRENINKVFLLGWSWGATIVARFSILKPELVNKIVLYTPDWVYNPPIYSEANPMPTID